MIFPDEGVMLAFQIVEGAKIVEKSAFYLGLASGLASRARRDLKLVSQSRET